MDNQTQQIRLQEIPDNPNDFVPEILPASIERQGTPPLIPVQQPKEKETGEPADKKDIAKSDEAVINPELATLFGEDPKAVENTPEDEKPTGISKAQLFDRLLTDESFRKAFIGKFEPDMIQTIDPEAFAFQKLQEEFGGDFIQSEFNVSESGIPGTKSFRYIKKYNEHISEAEAKAKTGIPEDFEQLVKDYEKGVQREQEKLQEEKLQVMKMYKWNDQSFEGFINFASKLSIIDLAYIYDKAQKAKQGSQRRQVSPVIMAPGTSNDQNIYQEMVNIFGPPISS